MASAEIQTEKRIPEDLGVEDAMKNLKINPAIKASNVSLSGPKDGSTSDAMSCISSGDATNSIKESEVDQETLYAEQGMYYPTNEYYGYYYPGFTFGEWDDQGYAMGAEGLELPAFQADNGSLVYYVPGVQPGYMPYSHFMPGAVFGADTQLVCQQPYYPNPFFSQPVFSPGFYPPSLAYGNDKVPAYCWDPSLYADGSHGNGFGLDPAISAPKPKFSSHSHNFAPSKASPAPRSSTLEMKGSLPIMDASPHSAVHNQALKSVNKATAVLPKGFFPINKFQSYSHQGKGGILHMKENGRTWVGSEKLKARTKAYPAGNLDMLNEQNRGPRTNGPKANLSSETNPVEPQPAEGGDCGLVSFAAVRKDNFNLADFQTKYDHAFFFVIKSYSEDDIHKSIKYNVWASTPNGNKRLDSAYQIAQEKMEEKGSKCPVFLFFSVNASGQFCGVAEMIGRVDFSKSMDFWQQDKWNGFFPVKWHIVKDIPNPQFRHIILENNDNKPVTNSRDTQEVKFPQGTEMLNIFKSYSSKTSIIDDFDFYENRQKVMQDKKFKQSTASFDHLLLKTDEKSQVARPGDVRSVVSGLPFEIATVKVKEELAGIE